MRMIRRAWQQLDHAMIRFMRANGIRALRVALGIVFVWFGALKVVGLSPVGDLVAGTVYWVDPRVFVPLLGIWEIAVGLGLLSGVAMRMVLLFFWLQMAGTFLVLVLRPELAFQRGNPLLLTTTGEFVIKNLVLIAAGLVIGSTIRPGAAGRSDETRSGTA